MKNRTSEIARAESALAFIIPILHKYGFRWVITGGFACYVYGVDRMLTDIDIDIDTSKDSSEFKNFLKELEPYITQPLLHFVDENYDNFNFELTYNNQIIDICPMQELLILSKDRNIYESFYKSGFPEIEIANFKGFELPLLTKEAIIKNKEMLIKKDTWQKRDIDELRKIINTESK